MNDRRHRRRLRWLAVLCGAVFVLAACGETSDDDGDVLDEPAVTATTAAAPSTVDPSTDGDGAAATTDEAATEADDESGTVEPTAPATTDAESPATTGDLADADSTSSDDDAAAG
ncbi:MAG: hypothetical protein AAGG08_16860, partial [Actinomycetota bacterium]